MFERNEKVSDIMCNVGIFVISRSDSVQENCFKSCVRIIDDENSI